MPLYRQVGDVLGEANCIQGLGDIARNDGDRETASQRYREVLALYETIAEPYSIGWTHHRLARIAEHDAEREGRLQAAREAWSSIDRQDLIGEYLENSRLSRPRRWLLWGLDVALVLYLIVICYLAPWWVSVSLVLYLIALWYLGPRFKQWLNLGCNKLYQFFRPPPQNDGE